MFDPAFEAEVMTNQRICTALLVAGITPKEFAALRKHMAADFIWEPMISGFTKRFQALNPTNGEAE